MATKVKYAAHLFWPKKVVQLYYVISRIDGWKTMTDVLADVRTVFPEMSSQRFGNWMKLLAAAELIQFQRVKLAKVYSLTAKGKAVKRAMDDVNAVVPYILVDDSAVRLELPIAVEHDKRTGEDILEKPVKDIDEKLREIEVVKTAGVTPEEIASSHVEVSDDVLKKLDGEDEDE